LFKRFSDPAIRNGFIELTPLTVGNVDFGVNIFCGVIVVVVVVVGVVVKVVVGVEDLGGVVVEFETEE
jgi:hypothetical protein